MSSAATTKKPRRLYLRSWFSTRFGLSGKLVLLVLLVLLPLMTLDAFQIVGRFEDQKEDELAADKDFARAISAAFTNFVASSWDEEQIIGDNIVRGGQPLPAARVREVLDERLGTDPSPQALAWVAADGTIISASKPGWVAPPPEELHFLDGLGPERLNVISDLLESPDGRQFSIGIAHALVRNGRYLGAVVSYLDPTRLRQALPVERPGSSAFSLVDQQGVIVYSDSIMTQMGHPGLSVSPDSPAHAALNHQTVTAPHFHSTVDGTLRMGAAAPIPLNPSTTWAAVASTALPDVMAGPRSATLRDLLVLLLVTAVSLGGASLMGRRFLRPLQSLQHAAREIAGGDLDARSGYEGTDELGQTVAVFDQMAEQVQALVAQREQFLQVAAHELRNPMTSVKGMLSLIRHRAATGRPMRDLAELAGVMENEIDRLSALLNEILDAFRMHNGRLELQFETVDITDLVRSAVEPFRVSSEAHRFKVIVPPHPVRVWGDRRRLEEVLRNLYGNAVKYSPDGGDVTVSLTRTAGRALLSVQDSGLGVPADQLSKIFEGFYRGTNLQGRDPGGLGLGLFICRDIIDRHGGRIWAESTEGTGTTFYVKLPLMQDEEAT